MRKSARLLGLELGKTAQQMNELLRECGYLEGEPGAYSLTDKGREYAKERDEHRGVGGYSHYNHAWTVRTWDEEILDALMDDIKDRRIASESDSDSRREDYYVTQKEDKSSQLGAEIGNECRDMAKLYAWLAVGATVVAGGIIVAPHAKRWWCDAVAPGAKKIWRKIVNIEKASDARKGESVQEVVAEVPEEDSGSAGT